MEKGVQTVFMVTSGHYSDYRVCAIFTEKFLAEKYINSFEEEFSIEEHTLNPFQYELVSNYKPFFLRMTKGGDCTTIRIGGPSSYGFEEGGINTGFDIYKDMYMSVFAKDEEHAIKIADERRIQLIAENRWGVDI